MDIFGTTITKSPEETAKLGEALGNYLIKTLNFKLQNRIGNSHATVVCLYGDLGSGKTTFVQGFGKAIGITSRLLSPTFFIVRRYSFPKRFGFFYHTDLYRMGNEQELKDIGITEMLMDSKSIVVFEWAEKLGSLLPRRRIDVRFSALPDDSHQIAIKK